jgi:AcrR family transcriptional regulator
MAEDVKRRYSSTLRDEQARATRRAVVDAARACFVSVGWTATTAEAIAAAAGVSRATVFSVGGKAELLKLAYDTAIVGDDEPVPMAARPAVRRIEQAPDGAVAIGLYVDLVLEVSARVAGVYVALRAAADSDPAVRALHDEVQQQRLTGARGMVASLQARGVLRPEIDPEAAADVVWALNDPGLYAALVDGRGWTPEHFGAWLRSVLVAELLGP